MDGYSSRMVIKPFTNLLYSATSFSFGNVIGSMLGNPCELKSLVVAKIKRSLRESCRNVSGVMIFISGKPNGTSLILFTE